MSENNNPIIETEALVHTYKTGVTALKGVNVGFYEGVITPIVGQNGSGKTTLVRHFNGLLRPTSGTVFLNGEDAKEKNVGAMAVQVGYVFQNPNHQIFCVSVKEELEVGPKNFGFTESQREEAIERVTELMDLGEILNLHPLTLDYTTKKIVTIASVLTYNPEILIMDEPTGGLDEQGRRMLTKIIRMMKDNGRTVLMISHDMDYVAQISERIVVMAEGEVIDDGTPTEVFQNAENLNKAQIEPPQIAQLDIRLKNSDPLSLNVDAFVEKYRQLKN